VKPFATAATPAPLATNPSTTESVVALVELRTSRIEAEAEELRRWVTQLRETEAERFRDLKLRSVAELAAGAGHEINNPLAVISGQAQFLLKSEESLDRAKALERIIHQSQRIHQLLRDLMVYAKPPLPQRKHILLDRIVAQAVATLVDQAVSREVTLAHIVTRQPVRVFADPHLVETALLCLIRNALEAAPACGWVRVRIETPSSAQVALVVEDNGPGFTAEQAEHLFDPFYSGRTAGRGPGLGLAKVWRIAQLHDGDILATAKPGEPTRFTLILPAAGRADRNGSHRLNGRSRLTPSRNGHARNGKLRAKSKSKSK
jgi:signal transduction histidine kinase